MRAVSVAPTGFILDDAASQGVSLHREPQALFIMESISASSPGLSCQFTAFAFARTCSGLLAPAMTDATALCQSNQENANSRMVWPFDSTNLISDSTIARFCSVKTLGPQRSAARLPSGNFLSLRYFPVSKPFSNGK